MIIPLFDSSKQFVPIPRRILFHRLHYLGWSGGSVLQLTNLLKMENFAKKTNSQIERLWLTANNSICICLFKEGHFDPNTYNSSRCRCDNTIFMFFYPRFFWLDSLSVDHFRSTHKLTHSLSSVTSLPSSSTFATKIVSSLSLVFKTLVFNTQLALLNPQGWIDLERREKTRLN